AGVYVVGAYTGFYVYNITHSFFLALLSSMMVSVLFGVVIQNYVYFPLLKYPPIVPLIAGIGIFISTQEGIRLIFGPYIKSFPNNLLNFKYHIWNASLSGTQLIVLVLSFVFIFILWYITERTKFGISLKAVSQDMEMAEVMSINSKKVTLYTFAIGSALAGIAGLLVGVYFNSVYPAMGDMPAYKALAIIVVGGMGNIWGTFYAAILVGLIETILIGTLSIPLPRDSLAFIFMIIVLLIKPEGLSFLLEKR
ncbi:MAG TPA: branched-chain amino acid ABC transporter permease, partial [Candidatus Atribacteria bacterium]|nr:branched-chain amino acid ABC transporter permease [Candidatus Atribacteria bacterium]